MDDILRAYMGVPSNADCMTEVRKLVYSTPNDGDLGAAIRNMIENDFGLKEPVIVMGDTIKVRHDLMEGQPYYDVMAETDSFVNRQTGEISFSFKHGGDMMMIAKRVDGEWVCN